MSKLVLALLIIQTAFTVIGAIAGMIAVRNRLRFDWAPRVFFGALIVVVIATGILDFYTRFNQYSNVSKAESATGWPLPSRTEISDLADDLRAYQPDETVIIYDDAQEEPLALAFAKAMHLANWTKPGMVGQLESPRLGIEIFVGSEVMGALEPLKKFCRKQLKTEPIIQTTAQGLSSKAIQITIGHDEAD